MSYVKRPVMLKRETTFLAWKAASQARRTNLLTPSLTLTLTLFLTLP